MASKKSDHHDSVTNWTSPEIAERRSRGRARRSAMHGQATQMMLDLAGVGTGSRVLDVAAGTGDQTLLAARRVGPTGYVLATDISAAMMKLAADAAREADLANVQTRIMDAENMDLEADSSMRLYVSSAYFCSRIPCTSCAQSAECFGQVEKLQR